MNETVLQKIEHQFAELQLNIRLAMEAHGVKVVDVHQFLLSFFQGVCTDIPEASELTILFNFVTKSQLWRYDHYQPLKVVADVFLPADHPARKHIVQYQSQFSGFLTTTKITDFINLSNSKRYIQPLNIEYNKLAISLKLSRKVKLSDLSMSYVDELWRALIEEFNLPPLTTIINRIESWDTKWLVIEWLVTKQVSAVVQKYYSKALRFYQQRNIVYVKVNNMAPCRTETLYHKSWIVSRYQVINI